MAQGRAVVEWLARLRALSVLRVRATSARWVRCVGDRSRPTTASPIVSSNTASNAARSSIRLTRVNRAAQYSSDRVRGKGVRRSDGTNGDLLVTVSVQVPQKLTGAARDALGSFREATAGEDPREELLRRAKQA